MRKEFYYPSVGQGEIFACQWIPEGDARGVVQIVHGIAEHSLRYEDFAKYLNGLGFVVVSEDHMGHGGSAERGSIKGYFHGGWFKAVEDTVQLLRLTKEQYPDVPYVLLGHSMGSFMARTILGDYPDVGIDACVLSGTAWQDAAVVKAGSMVYKIVCALSDETTPGVKTNKMLFGSYNQRIAEKRTPSDWLSRDNAVVDAYELDPMCGFIASSGLQRDMIQGIGYIQKKETLEAMKKTLPVLFAAGEADPVGNYGTGVRKAYDMFRGAGMKHVDIILYPECRHEILNELNRADVYRDISEWIQKAIQK